MVGLDRTDYLNILENNRIRLRLLAQALGEDWDVERTEQEIGLH